MGKRSLDPSLVRSPRADVVRALSVADGGGRGVTESVRCIVDQRSIASEVLIS